jgi:hypothetical protein
VDLYESFKIVLQPPIISVQHRDHRFLYTPTFQGWNQIGNKLPLASILFRALFDHRPILDNDVGGESARGSFQVKVWRQKLGYALATALSTICAATLESSH